MSDVRYSVQVDATGAVTSIQKLDAAWKGIDETHGKVSKSAGSLWKQFALGQIAFDMARKGAQLLKAEFLDSLKQAADYEKALKGLNAAFEISGRTMPGMAANLKNYASELEKLGLAEDDEVLRSESLLLQLTRLNEKGVKEATRGAIGLASVFGMDLQSATEQVAKGMEGNFLMLNRLIPAVREATTEEGKRAAMMKTFESLYARAIADTQTYAGQVKMLGLEWKNAKQELGGAILETGVLQGAMEGLTVVIKGLTGTTAREHKAATLEQIEANNKAGESLRKMAEQLGWNRTELASLRTHYNLSSTQLLSWVKDNLLGADAAKALAAVLKLEAEELAKTNQGFSETGTGMAVTTAYVQSLEDRYEALNDDLRAFRMLSSQGRNIEPPKPETKGTLGDMIGGDLGKVVDSVDKVEGLFDGLKTSVGKTMTDMGTELSNLSAQMFGDMVNGFTSVMDGSVKMGDIFSKIATTMIADLGKMVIAEMMFGKASIVAAQMQAVAHFIASIFKKVPFPVNLVLAAGAFAVVSALFKKLLKFEQGGVFTKPTIAEVGHGTEYVLPERKLINLVRDAMRMPAYAGAPAMAMAGVGGGGVTVHFNGPLISTVRLSDADIASAGAKIKAEVVRQMHRLG